ncbi:5-hydroxyisourate hydrolase isoform X1 [Anastrepha ludens]|uniref:5-hydroxyisourate hydrolase isoform X1 n=1 Tax=Anastrepha ludens TaxID=28586 RepID=UPI0023AEC16C|nr:5-hydroxyisourate hydrolase isoform X1 [Anastrepha ludens]
MFRVYRILEQLSKMTGLVYRIACTVGGKILQSRKHIVLKILRDLCMQSEQDSTMKKNPVLFVTALFMYSAFIQHSFEPVTSNNVSANVSTISAHILDTTVGQAAQNVNITIYRLEGADHWQKLNEERTNQDGRVSQLVSASQYKAGIYKLHFDVEAYHAERGVKSFYPFIEIVVKCEQDQHYHIPLLLNPFGYTTYRGT